jgi:hypothetical protein
MKVVWRAGRAWVRRAGDWLERCPRWQWLAVGWGVLALLPVVCSWPRFGTDPAIDRVWRPHFERVVAQKIADPWHDYTREFAPGKNEAKRNFRVAVPLVAHLTGTGLAGVHATRLALQAVLLLTLLLAAERACRDRRMALGLALAVAGTYVGTSVWRDVCLWFDHCAYGLLAVALLARGPGLAMGAVVLAAFTDERALLAVPALVAFHRWTGAGAAVRLALAAAVPAYVALRLGLRGPLEFWPPGQGVGNASVVARNLEVAAPGLWSALEGGWIALVAAGAWLAREAAGRREAVLAVAGLLPVAAAFAVGDFTRSAAYAFPAVLAAGAVLARPGAGEAGGRRVAWLAAAWSLAVPNLFVMDQILVEQWLPVVAFNAWLGGGGG